jgi:hypothetical protein
MSRPNRRLQRLSLFAVMIAVALCWLTGCGEEPVPLGRVSDGERVTELKLDDGKQFVEQDGRRVGGTFESVRGLRHTPDGEAVFIAKADGAWSVMRGEKPMGERYDEVGFVRISPKGSVVYAASHGETWKIVVDGQALDWALHSIHDIVFSPDGESLAFSGMQNDKPVIIRNGNKIPLDGDYRVGELRFSRDGTSLYGVGLTDSGSALLRDGRPITGFFEGVAFWAVSSDGRSTVVVEERSNNSFRIVKDGTPIGQIYISRADFTYPVFAPDGRSVGYFGALPPPDSPPSDEGPFYRTFQGYRDGIAEGQEISADDISSMIFSADGRAFG